MKTKSKWIFYGLAAVLVLIVSLAFPKMQTEVLAAEDSQTTLTIKNKGLYNELISTFKVGNNQGAVVNSDETTKTITLKMEKVTYIEIERVDMSKDNSASVLNTLLAGCANLKTLLLVDCNPAGVKLSELEKMKNLSSLTLTGAGFTQIPSLKLGSLTHLNLSANNFSADGACANFTSGNFPKLRDLYLDGCQISKLNFLQEYGRVNNLETLSLGNDRLTDDSLEALLGMGGGCLSKLKNLYLGIYVHKGNSTSSSDLDSTNKFTNPSRLASLPASFPNLMKLDLTSLRITSLRAFADAGVRNDIEIDFCMNKIQDLAGFESNKNFKLGGQKYIISGNFAPGWECEMPELVKNILDPNHVLHGTLRYINCRLSDNGEKLFIEPNAREAYVEVTKGRLCHEGIFTKIRFSPLRQIPSCTIPQGLTATEGDTLAKVPLPEGLAWKDSFLGVGTAGTHTFKAVYTPEDTAQYITIEVDIPVTVKKAATVPKEPEVTPAPDPEPLPEEKPAPDDSDKPDESHLTGNQIEDRKDLSLLLATGKQKGKNSIELTWKKKNGCSGYEVYWSYCDGKRNFKKAKTVKSTGKRTYIHKNLKKTRAYKYYIATYKMKNGKKVYQSKSPTIHVAMSQEKNTNVKSISVNKTKVSLKAKKTFQIKVSAKAENKKKKLLSHTDKFRYYTNDKKVATVTKKGKIQAKKKGSCSIFVIANNGVSKEIKVTVK